MPEDYRVRLTAALYKAAELLLLHGASPSEIDEAVLEAGHDLGPFEAQDLYGLDTVFEFRKNGFEERFPHLGNLIISDRMVSEGKLGKKVNAGWYRYPGGNGKVEDPIVEDLVIEESWFAGIERHDFAPQEVLGCLVVGIVLEAERILIQQSTITREELCKFMDELFPDTQEKIAYRNHGVTLQVMKTAERWQHTDNIFWSLPNSENNE